MFNTHDPTSSPRAGNQSKWRVYDAKVHLKDMEEMYAKGIPTFMTGDFNSAFEIRHPEDNGLSRDELTYCILTSTGNIHNAYDVYNKKSGHCPTTKAKDSKGSKIDHIYLTTGIQVANWQKIDDPDVDFATDHPVVFADIIIPGSGSSADNSGETASAKGYVWPIAKADSKGLTNCYQKPGHTGIDFSAATGTKVRAAKDGKVVEVKTGVEGYSMSDAGGNYIIIQHNDGHWTNYQHNSKVLVTVGKDVKAGDVIALSGYTGYTRPAGKGGEHLHFTITTQKGLDSRNSVAYSINPTPFLPNDRNMGACGAP